MTAIMSTLRQTEAQTADREILAPPPRGRGGGWGVGFPIRQQCYIDLPSAIGMVSAL